jgi:hypothetical protein
MSGERLAKSCFMVMMMLLFVAPPSEALVVWLQAVDAESAITAQAAHNAWRYFWTTIMAFLSG